MSADARSMQYNFCVALNMHFHEAKGMAPWSHDELWYAETFDESCWLQACYHCRGCLVRAILVALWFQASYNVSFHVLIEEDSKQDVAILALWHSSIVFDERCRSTCSVGLTCCWGSAMVLSMTIAVLSLVVICMLPHVIFTQPLLPQHRMLWHYRCTMKRLISSCFRAVKEMSDTWQIKIKLLK